MVEPTAFLGPVAQVFSAARQKQQLDGFSDLLVLDSLERIMLEAARAASHR